LTRNITRRTPPNFGQDFDLSTPAFDGWPEFDEDDPTQSDGCIFHNDDFLQYYLGAYIHASGGNTAEETDDGYFPFDMTGVGQPYQGLTWGFNGPGGAGNQDHTATFAITSSLLDPQRYPLYADSRSLASWLRPGAGPFSPFSGQFYMASNAHNASYKRLGKTIDLSGATSAELSFKFSSDLEEAWDFMFVEVHDLDEDTWTTLPAVEGFTDDDTGDSCAEGIANGTDTLHPWLLHYYDTNCESGGTTGEWNAFTGNSGGWQDWTVDLTPYAGKHVEVFITNVTDWATLGLGTWVDDIVLTVDDAVAEFTDFESGTGGWAPSPPPEGTEFADANWERATQQFIEGGVVGTTDTVFTGFGFEGIDDATRRREFMRRTLRYLGVLRDNPGSGGTPPGQPGAKHASLKIKVGKRLRASRKGRVKVRLACEGDAGATCAGRVRFLRRGKSWGGKRVTMAAGETDRVKVKLREKAFRRLKRKDSQRVTLRVSGKDSAGTAFAEQVRVKLLEPKRKKRR
jgi:hypothetical protein